MKTFDIEFVNGVVVTIAADDEAHARLQARGFGTAVKSVKVTGSKTKKVATKPMAAKKKAAKKKAVKNA